MGENNKKKCSYLRCNTCENYDRYTDFCKEKNIEHCSGQLNTDFSACNEYLIRKELVMF